MAGYTLRQRILEWVAISDSIGSSQPREWTHISCIFCNGRQILYHCATWEAPLFYRLGSPIIKSFSYLLKIYSLSNHYVLGIRLEVQKCEPNALKNSRIFSGIDFTFQFSSVQSLSRVRLFATPWIAARQASPSITNSRSSLRLTSIESVMPSSHLILCHPLLLLPPIPPTIRVFSNESTLCMWWPKDWSFSFSIIPSKDIPGLISFRMDWLDLLAVQGLSRVFSNTTVQKHQFFGTQPSSQFMKYQIGEVAVKILSDRKVSDNFPQWFCNIPVHTYYYFGRSASW